MEKLTNLLKDYRELYETLEPLNDKLKGIKEAINEEMEKIPNDYLKVDNVSATKVTIKRVTYNKSKLEEIFTQEQLEPARSESVSNFIKLTVSKSEKD